MLGPFPARTNVPLWPMPDPAPDPNLPHPYDAAIRDLAGRDRAAAVARGVGRTLIEHGFSVLTEFPLISGRRVDVIGLGRDGEFTVVEIKTSVADFRSDGKWPDYLDFCDRFYFAVPEDFPLDILPDEEGLMVADGFAAAVVREAPVRRMNGNRRGSQTRKFARTAGLRLFSAQYGDSLG